MKTFSFFFFFFLETTCFWAEKTLEFSILAGKSISIAVKTFFFLETSCFWAEKPLEFPSFQEIPSQFSDKPCDSDSRAIKIRVKVVCTFLTLSKKPPPLFQILATRLEGRLFLEMEPQPSNIYIFFFLQKELNFRLILIKSVA